MVSHCPLSLDRLLTKSVCLISVFVIMEKSSGFLSLHIMTELASMFMTEGFLSVSLNSISPRIPLLLLPLLATAVAGSACAPLASCHILVGYAVLDL